MFQTRGSRKTLAIRVRRCWQLYLFLLLPVAYLIVFKYVPCWASRSPFANTRRAWAFGEANGWGWLI